FGPCCRSVRRDKHRAASRLIGRRREHRGHRGPLARWYAVREELGEHLLTLRAHALDPESHAGTLERIVGVGIDIEHYACPGDRRLAIEQNSERAFGADLSILDRVD